MPSIMTLQGPRGPIRSSGGATLLGVTDTIKGHPWAIVVGLILGGYLAKKKINPIASIWGDQRMSQARSKNLTGPRRRGRKR